MKFLQWALAIIQSQRNFLSWPHGVRYGQKFGRANTEYIVYNYYNVYKTYSIKQFGKNIIK